MNKFLRVFLIIFFPLGILYCIGHCLFKGDFANFLGAMFILGIGILLGMYLMDKTIFDGIINFIRGLVK